MPSSKETAKVDGRPMELYCSRPSGKGPFPAVVVIQHAGGVDAFIRAMADRLSQAGYVAAAPDLYHRLEKEGADNMALLRQLKDQEVIADVRATVEFLQRHPAVQSQALGITGFCMGGRVVYLMAAVVPDFRAAVAYYGGNIMVPWGEGVPSPFERTAQLGCPLLFHFGEEDKNPSSEDREKLDAALSQHGKEHEFYSYPGAGHAFMDFTRQERYREEASRLSWERTLEFFGRHLRPRR